MPNRKEIIARPTLMGTKNPPMKTRLHVSKGDVLEVQFIITVNPEARFSLTVYGKL